MEFILASKEKKNGSFKKVQDRINSIPVKISERLISHSNGIAIKSKQSTFKTPIY